jgi:hypothetical protein
MCSMGQTEVERKGNVSGISTIFVTLLLSFL